VKCKLKTHCRIHPDGSSARSGDRVAFPGESERLLAAEFASITTERCAGDRSSIAIPDTAGPDNILPIVTLIRPHGLTEPVRGATSA
jgi:hypothetical protein